MHKCCNKLRLSARYFGDFENKDAREKLITKKKRTARERISFAVSF